MVTLVLDKMELEFCWMIGPLLHGELGDVEGYVTSDCACLHLLAAGFGSITLYICVSGLYYAPTVRAQDDISVPMMI